MNRQAFVTGLLGGAIALKQGNSPRIQIEPQSRLGSIPADFVGLGYEVSSVSERGLLSGSNRAYVQFVRTLGPAGVLRIGRQYQRLRHMVVTAPIALRTARYFGTSPDVWLGIQIDYDLAITKDREGARIEREVRPIIQSPAADKQPAKHQSAG